MPKNTQNTTTWKDWVDWLPTYIVLGIAAAYLVDRTQIIPKITGKLFQGGSSQDNNQQ